MSLYATSSVAMKNNEKTLQHNHVSNKYLKISKDEFCLFYFLNLKVLLPKSTVAQKKLKSIVEKYIPTLVEVRLVRFQITIILD